MRLFLFKRILIVSWLAIVFSLPLSSKASCEDYLQVAGLIDLRTTFSDGKLDPESLVKLARERGFHIVCINDHDRLAMEYGLFPLRNILKKRVELNSINLVGAEKYLKNIRRLREVYPDMIIIPGSETAPFYYWSGSCFSGDLTANNHEKRILTIGMERAEDYTNLPIVHNGFSLRYTNVFLPFTLFFFVPFVIGLVLLRWKKSWRIAGLVISGLSLLFMINTAPFRSSPFDQYHGDQGIAPYQLVIDYVDSRGGVTFWNYPETRSGVRKMGPIFLQTSPYPQVLNQSSGYTGFAALYGDNITATEPGHEWDRALMEYCRGRRKRPVWGISTADFHSEGSTGEKLANFPTIFLVHKKTREEVLFAMRGGKMYACRGKYPQCMMLDEFSVSSSMDELIGISGDEINLTGNPRVRISLFSKKPCDKIVSVRLIRSGRLVKTIEGKLPMEIHYEDKYSRPGEKIYYRVDASGCGKLVTNPVFVTFM